MSKECCPEGFYAFAESTGTSTAESGDIVTATASASAVSLVSYKDAETIASQLASQVAQETAENDANVISQTLTIINSRSLIPSVQGLTLGDLEKPYSEIHSTDGFSNSSFTIGSNCKLTTSSDGKDVLLINGAETYTSSNLQGSQETVGNNTFYGYNSLGQNTVKSEKQLMVYGSSSGVENTAYGDSSSGVQNTACGNSSLSSNTSGSYNSAFGSYSLYLNTTGSANTAIGVASLYSNATGDSNTAIGYISLYYNTTGNYNTAIGYGSLDSNATGDSNTAIGYGSVGSNTTGYNNTAIGYGSLDSNTTGYNNTAIGYIAGYSSTDYSNTYSNTTCLGANTTVSASNQAQLGDSNTTTYCFGSVQDRSDIRDKADIRDTQLGLEFINKLHPVDFKWDYREDYREIIKKTDETKKAFEIKEHPKDGSKKRNRYHHGLIAQEVQSLLSELNIDFGGFQDHSVKGGEDVLSIGYGELIGPMIKAIQTLSAQNNELVTTIREMKIKNSLL